MKKHYYISVMGAIGSGKTTASKLLSRKLHFTLLEEHFGDNAFLPRFYQDMKRWAFHSQMFFLMEKIKQMVATQKTMKRHSIIQDTPIQQDAFSYAKAQYILGNMDDAEWWLYLKVYRTFEPFLPVPDLIIYLDAPAEHLLGRIQHRGRSYEKNMPKNYLELLDMLNHRWLRENKSIPTLMVKKDQLDILHNKKAREKLVAAVQKALNTKPLSPISRQVIHLGPLEV